MLNFSQSYFQLAGILSWELVLAFERVAILVLGTILSILQLFYLLFTLLALSVGFVSVMSS